MTQELIPISNYYKKFYDLMPNRIFNILLVSSLYDYFILEKDGILEDKVLTEYQHHNIQYAPKIRHVTTANKALAILEEHRFDLVITSLKLADIAIRNFVEKVKTAHPKVPLVLLTKVTDDIEKNITQKTIDMIDHVFVWSGDARLLFTIAKLLEDERNVDLDTQTGNVRVIIVVEDKPRYYSFFLPMIYSEVMKQNKELIDEGLNIIDEIVRMRSRPKILLAKNYEEAINLFKKYKNNVLGVISDIAFPKDGKLNNSAGFILVEDIKHINPYIPVILQSAEDANETIAHQKKAHFINKNSNTMLQQLRSFILEYFGFGDFIFRDNSNNILARAATIKEFEKILHTIPAESLVAHAQNNHFSHWLFARGEFILAKLLREQSVNDFPTPEDIRQHLITTIHTTRKEYQVGLISDFKRKSFDKSFAFMKVGSGSMGGKGRSLAFINTLISNNVIKQKFPNVKIAVPKTFIIASDEFISFIENNHFESRAYEFNDDSKVLKAFLSARLSPTLISDLKTFLEHVCSPLAIRSSSLFEDSQDQPFAGLYETYMLANNHPDINIRLEALCNAIKSVYASTYFKEVKTYFDNTSFRLEEEKMSVVIQEIVGSYYGNYFYPHLSGVAQSYNYYPIGHMKASDGIANIVLGFGKAVVDGEASFRFCPKYPQILPQFSTCKDILKYSQKKFYALDLTNNEFPKDFNPNNDMLTKLNIRTARDHSSLNTVGSIYSPEDDRLYDGTFRSGAPVVTFSNILKNSVFPLADILSYLLNLTAEAFGSPIEMEFAIDKISKDEISNFYILQARPFLAKHEYEAIDFTENIQRKVFCQSSTALGNGRVHDIHDIIYLDPEKFDPLKTMHMVDEISTFNKKMVQNKKPYLLIGIGRWGTRDPSLGVPITWSQISGAEVIIEANLKDFHVEPSNGTHFFHNLTSCKTGYIAIEPRKKDDLLDWNWLSQQNVVEEKTYSKHITTNSPLEIKIDGHTSRAMIYVD